jgi:hypothetical protein
MHRRGAKGSQSERGLPQYVKYLRCPEACLGGISASIAAISIKRGEVSSGSNEYERSSGKTEEKLIIHIYNNSLCRGLSSKLRRGKL